jgi:16S rRNA (guanine966-N2)-methyltransferase
MRIIAGEYRGRILKSPSDHKTRPTSDRLRETLFNILNPLIDEQTRFLDLCSGTGAIGIEALSRGVSFTTFIDKSRRACGLIEENLDLLRIPEMQTEIVCNTAESFVARPHQNAWHMVFYDPPYKTDYSIVLSETAASDSGVLAENGVLIVEHHTKTMMPDAIGGIRRWRIVKQGETHLSFYEKH